VKSEGKEFAKECGEESDRPPAASRFRDGDGDEQRRRTKKSKSEEKMGGNDFDSECDELKVVSKLRTIGYKQGLRASERYIQHGGGKGR